MADKQKAVMLGLRRLAQRVEDGMYGKGDNAFDDDDGEGEEAQTFLNDLHDNVLDSME